ncbi:Os01g0372450, partial [Oryza sativa Japonica Group]
HHGGHLPDRRPRQQALPPRRHARVRAEHRHLVRHLHEVARVREVAQVGEAHLAAGEVPARGLQPCLVHGERLPQPRDALGDDPLVGLPAQRRDDAPLDEHGVHRGLVPERLHVQPRVHHRRLGGVAFPQQVGLVLATRQ